MADKDFSLRLVYASAGIAASNGATEADLLAAVRAGIARALRE